MLEFPSTSYGMQKMCFFRSWLSPRKNASVRHQKVSGFAFQMLGINIYNEYENLFLNLRA